MSRTASVTALMCSTLTNLKYSLAKRNGESLFFRSVVCFDWLFKEVFELRFNLGFKFLKFNTEGSNLSVFGDLPEAVDDFGIDPCSEADTVIVLQRQYDQRTLSGNLGSLSNKGSAE